MSRQEQRMSILREVAYRADLFYEDAERLGQKAARALTSKKRSQITGLEAVANSALKTSDVFDFIKTRTARHEEWRKENFGPELLSFLTEELGRDCRNIRQALNIQNKGSEELRKHLKEVEEILGTRKNIPKKLRKRLQEIGEMLEIQDTGAEKIEIHLLLIREFVRQLSAQYEWKIRESDDEANT